MDYTFLTFDKSKIKLELLETALSITKDGICKQIEFNEIRNVHLRKNLDGEFHCIISFNDKEKLIVSNLSLDEELLEHCSSTVEQNVAYSIWITELHKKLHSSQSNNNTSFTTGHKHLFYFSVVMLALFCFLLTSPKIALYSAPLIIGFLIYLLYSSVGKRYQPDNIPEKCLPDREKPLDVTA